MEPTFYFHSHVQVISRGNGKSAVAAAAYRAGETIKNEYDGVIHDYTRKGGIVHSEIILPDHAPREYYDRAILWNAVEKIEKANNSQLARELDLALPAVFTLEQNIALAREYVKKTFVDAGMCADLCLHDTGEGNPHMHIMLTMRPINEDGTWGGKQKKDYILDRDGNKIYDPKKRSYKCRSIPSTDWNDRGNADKWRAAWEDTANAELERLGFDIRIDRRTYAEQGIEQIPTVHMGVAAMQMEKRGIRTERGDMNRAVAVTNQQVKQLRARINYLKDWIYSQPIQNMPTMGEMMAAINAAQNMKSRWQKIRNLQTAAKVLIFLQQNGIDTPEQFADKITQLHQRHYDLAGDVKKKERRIAKLNEHLANVDDYNQHRAVYTKYKSLAPKKDKAALNSLNPFTKSKAVKEYEAAKKRQAAYYEKHAGEIEKYETALDYLKAHLNGYGKIPEKDWRTEHKRLIGERNAQLDEYYNLNDEVKSAEALRRGAEYHMRDIMPERTTPTKTQGVDIG